MLDIFEFLVIWFYWLSWNWYWRLARVFVNFFIFENFLEVNCICISLFKFVVFNFLGNLLSDEDFRLTNFFWCLLESFKSSISVLFKGSSLFFLPDLDVSLNCLENKSLLHFCQFTILAHSIQAHNELLFFSAELIKIDFFPGALFRLPLLTGSNRLFFGCLLLEIERFLLLLLHFLSLFHILPVSDCLTQRVVKKTALVDKRDCHEAAESGDALKVHARLTDDFLYVDVFESVHKVDICNTLVALSVDSCHCLVQAAVLFTKYIVGDSFLRR